MYVEHVPEIMMVGFRKVEEISSSYSWPARVASERKFDFYGKHGVNKL